MVNSSLIVELYQAVFDKHKNEFNLSSHQILNGMSEIGEAYAPNPMWENKWNSSSTYYEDAAHRCAYLHKHAMVHTGLLWDLLDQTLKVHTINAALSTDRGADCLRLCSLGSGPGTDIVAFLFVLKEYFGIKRTHATLVDCCGGWKCVFDDIVSELGNSRYVGDMASNENFQYEYNNADLLDFDDWPLSLSTSIRNADIIMMVKFVSAAGCRKTREMVKRIFCAMRPGALLLFIDNAAGGFQEMMSQAAKTCRMKSVFNLKHYHYMEKAFCHNFCTRISQFETTVAFEVWKKVEVLQPPWNTTSDLQRQFFERIHGARFSEEDFPALNAVGGVRRVSDSGDTENVVIEISHTSGPEEGTSGNCCIIM